MQSKARTVSEYLAGLPADRRAAVAAVREVFLKNLDKDYEEGMQYGMIGYCVPHRIYPAGYHCDPKQPLPFGGIASQKNHMSLHMMSVYGDSPLKEWFVREWKKTGKRLDMGKACIRFKKLDDLALGVIGEAIRRVPARKWIEIYEKATVGRRKETPARAEKPAATSAAKKRKPAAPIRATDRGAAARRSAR